MHNASKATGTLIDDRVGRVVDAIAVTTKEAALEYAIKGWSVFPCRAGTKRPHTEHGCLDATTDPEQIHEWWREWPDANVAIATGQRSGLAVIDFDIKDGARGLESLDVIESMTGSIETLTLTTPSGGFHLYFEHPKTVLKNRVGFMPGVDFRTEGGYVVAPPSIVDGKKYTRIIDVDPRPLPEELLRKLQEDRTSTPTPMPTVPPSDLTYRVQKYLEATPPAIQGEGGDDHTYQVACRLVLGFGLSESETFSLMSDWNNRCRPPWSDAELQQKIANAKNYGKESYGGRIGDQHNLPPAAEVDLPAEPNGEVEGLAVVSMRDVVVEEIQWLWKPYIPSGKVTLLDGDPGVGKSFCTLAITSGVTLGRGVPGVSNMEPGRVLLMSVEDGLADTIKPRLQQMGADDNLIYATDKLITLDDTGCRSLAKTIADYRPKLVIIDPLFAFTGAKVDINRANETREILSRLAAIAAEYQCAIVCVRHLTKGGRDKAIYRGIGSIDLVAACRSVLLAGVDPKDPTRRAITHTKSNLAQLGAPVGYSLDDTGTFSWTGQSTLTADEILAPHDTAEASKIQRARDFLNVALGDGPLPQKEIEKRAKDAEISYRTVERAKEDLGVNSTKVGVRWYWGK